MKLSAIALLLFVTAYSPASAAPSQDADSGSDVVRLRDGGFLRGRIQENVPGDHVVIVLLSGELRTVAQRDYTYAGPLESQEVVDASALAKVHLRATSENIGFHVYSGAASAITVSSAGLGASQAKAFNSLCIAPCEIDVKPGSYRLGLADGQAIPIEAKEIVRIDGPTTLEGEYTSHAWIRWTALGTFGALIGSGTAIACASFCSTGGYGTRDQTAMYVGTGLILSSLLAIPFLFWPDSVHVRVVPQN